MPVTDYLCFSWPLCLFVWLSGECLYGCWNIPVLRLTGCVSQLHQIVKRKKRRTTNKQKHSLSQIPVWAFDYRVKKKTGGPSLRLCVCVCGHMLMTVCLSVWCGRRGRVSGQQRWMPAYLREHHGQLRVPVQRGLLPERQPAHLHPPL